MASSGSITSGPASSYYYNRTITLSWSVASQSTANNTTTINWSLTGSGGDTGNWVTSGNFYVSIDGAEVYSSEDRINVYNGTVIASGSFTMSHNNEGDKSFSAYIEAGIGYYAVSQSASGSWSLPKIARKANITSAPNFTDMQNPTIGYSNPAGNSVASLQAAIYDSTGNQSYAPYRNISKTGSSYTFELTEQERQNLRYATINSPTLTVRFYIRTIIGNNTFYSYADKILTIVDANPTFTASYADDNATTVAITDNDQLIVRNQSQLELNVANLSAKKGASIRSVVANINGTDYNGTISGTACTINVGALNVSSNTTANLTVTDSRAYSTSQTLNITVLNWELPNAIITKHRENNYYSNTTIKVDGSYSSVDGKNAMTIKLRYKKTTDSTWSSYVTMQDNVAQTFNLDNTFAWDLQVVVSDKFGSTTYNDMVSRGMPIAYFDALNSSVGFNCFPVGTNSVEANGVPLDRNVMSYGLTANVTNPTTNNYTKVPLNNPVITGTRLTANSNGVKIGKGVSKVLVSAQMMVLANTKAGLCYIRIAKNNGNDVLAWCIQTVPAGGRSILSIAPTLVNVAENDVINMYYYVPDSDDHIYGSQISSATTGSLTWMTVDVAG